MGLQCLHIHLKMKYQKLNQAGWVDAGADKIANLRSSSSVNPSAKPAQLCIALPQLLVGWRQSFSWNSLLRYRGSYSGGSSRCHVKSADCVVER